MSLRNRFNTLNLKKRSSRTASARSGDKRTSQSSKKTKRTSHPNRRRRVLGLGLGVVVLILLLGGLGVWGYLQGTKVVPAQGGTLHEGVLEAPQHINPLYASPNQTDRDITSLLYPSLFTYTAQGKLQGDLVQSSNVSNNGKTYELALKRNRSWQDGTSIDADDVLFTIRAIQNKKTQSPLRKRLKGVDITKTDSHTVKMKLPDSYSPFKSRLTFGILPEHVWGEVTPSDMRSSSKNLRPIGGGPYMFESLSRENGRITTYKLKRNPNYSETTPRISHIVFHIYSEPRAMIRAFEEGTLTNMAPNSALTFNSENSPTQHRLRTSQYFALFFNTKTAPLDNQVLRTSLRLALNKDDLISSNIGKQGEPLYGPLTPTNRFYIEQTGTTDFSKAQRLLFSDGCKYTNNDGIRENGDTSASFDIVYSKGGNNTQLLRAIKQRGKKLGIDISLTPVPFSELRTSFVESKDYDYDALYAGQALQIYPDPYVYWHSSQIEETGLNLSQYSVIEVDKFLESARTNTSTDVIQSSLAQFQTRIRKDVPAIFTHSRTILYYTRPSVKNVTVSRGTDASDRFQTISQWYMETKRVWDGF